ncbi:hypothetical protein HDU86_006561 [Geranomyces michiganensis]|nr:hypothetical protein HDU86_006561 [Geranomyces michiganensis]
MYGCSGDDMGAKSLSTREAGTVREALTERTGKELGRTGRPLDALVMGDHPLIIGVLEKVKAGKKDVLDDSVYVLFEATSIASGISVRNASNFAKKVEAVVRERLGVDAKAEPRFVVVPAPEVEKEKSMSEIEDTGFVRFLIRYRPQIV